MHSRKAAFLYGLLIWLIPYVVAIIIFPVRESNRILFESVMPVVITFSVVLFGLRYFKNVEKNFLREGVLLSVIWLLISIIIDFFMFLRGPFRMMFMEYVSDIGITYLIIPLITIGFGMMLEKHP